MPREQQFDLAKRAEFAANLCEAAGQEALRFFEDRENLTVEAKGAQDWVSEADQTVELFIRKALGDAYPEDGIVGEEHDTKESESGFTWVIDPIDGTTNFVNGIPNWTVVLAGVAAGKTEIGIIHDPVIGETFSAVRDQGAHLNGVPMHVDSGKPLEDGTISVGFCNRIKPEHVLPVLEGVIRKGAMYHRNASGALSLAYVAAGRLLGFVEAHMNAWDCLAGQLLIAEAGGVIEDQDADEMIRHGGRVIAATPDVFPTLKDIAIAAWEPDTTR
ncbi:MAG: inositol monophosphatase [Pseudomonadota bacterium]